MCVVWDRQKKKIRTCTYEHQNEYNEKYSEVKLQKNTNTEINAIERFFLMSATM